MRTLRASLVIALGLTTAIAACVTEEVEEDAPAAGSALDATCTTARVTTAGGDVNVRAGRSTTSTRVGKLTPGTVIVLVEREGGWARIEAPVAGWVSEQFLTCVAVGAAPEPAVPTCREVARGITDCALQHELMWVDKEHSVLDANGKCRYVPPDLSPIGITAVRHSDPSAPRRVRALIQPDLEAMLRDANDAARAHPKRLLVDSAYRDFALQKEKYVKWRNECVSAYPGHSEHQLGTAVDLFEDGNSTFSCTTGFDTTVYHRWLTEHAHEYGFTLSYPHCNSANYREETWHLRWVGRAIATEVFDARKAAAATMPAVVAESISFRDWLVCHSEELVLVSGHVKDATGATRLVTGQYASLCSAMAGTRYGKATDSCAGYCSGRAACQPRDMTAVCALFPRLAPATSSSSN